MNKNRLVGITIFMDQIHMIRQQDVGRLTATVFKIRGWYDPRYQKVMDWMFDHDFIPVHHDFWCDTYIPKWNVSDAIKERGWTE